mmetsp:Transcript_40787/g.93884  ORF Transcript_40787/g.93884 Transcript_40787/m.93884 type:complete len:203 (-) Transcript_40787:1503-2111(-)
MSTISLPSSCSFASSSSFFAVSFKVGGLAVGDGSTIDPSIALLPLPSSVASPCSMGPKSVPKESRALWLRPTPSSRLPSEDPPKNEPRKLDLSFATRSSAPILPRSKKDARSRSSVLKKEPRKPFAFRLSIVSFLSSNFCRSMRLFLTRFCRSSISLRAFSARTASYSCAKLAPMMVMGGAKNSTPPNTHKVPTILPAVVVG